MISQLHAGYVLPGVRNALVESRMVTEPTLRCLLRGWSCFDVEAGTDLAGGKVVDDAVLKTAANLVSRGLPTLPGVEMQQHVDRSFGCTETRIDESGGIEATARGFAPTQTETLLDMLRAVDPRVAEDAVLQSFAHSKTAGLLKLLLPPLRELFGPAISHLLIADEKRPSLRLPFPSPLNGIHGLRAFVAQKEAAGKGGVQSDGWYDIPVSGTDGAVIARQLQEVRALLPNDALPLVVQDSRMLRPEQGDLLQLLLAPLAAARLQAVFLALLLRGSLDFSAETLRVLVIERDVPAAALAFADLEKLLAALLALEGKGRQVPALEITVRASGAFAASKLHAARPVRMLRKGDPPPEVDCRIDISMLLRAGLPADELPGTSTMSAVIRSAREAVRQRRLHLGSPVAWKAAGGKDDTNDSARTSAQQHLLRRVFRLAALSPERRALFERMLSRESVIAALPSDSGKTMLAHLAGLLQPAPSVVLLPDSSHVMDQRDMLEEHWIDADTALHEALGREERTALLRSFAGRETLFLHAPATLGRQEEVVATFESMGGEGVRFAQCVIDDAQGLSEWSDDFHPAFPLTVSFAVHALPAGKDAHLPLRLLTATPSYEILADLRRLLAQAGRAYLLRDAQVLHSNRVLGEGTRYYVLPVPTDDKDGDGSDAKKTVLRNFLPQLPAFFKELQDTVPKTQRLPERALQHFFNPSTRQGGIVFCGEGDGPHGVTGRFSGTDSGDGIAEAVTDVKGVRAGVCIAGDRSARQSGRKGQEESDRDRRRYRRGERNLLVATHDCGVGAGHPGTRYVLHAGLPAGLEQYLRESARAGKDGRLALSAVLYDPGTQAQAREMRRAEERLHRSMLVPEKEKQLIHELLREISYPEDSNTGRIANLIADEYGIELRVSYWQRGLDERMYLQEGGQNYGYVDLVTQEIVPEPKHPAGEFARELLDFACRSSLEAAGSGPSLSSWVAATFPSDVDDGLALQMQDFDSGATFTLRLGFENDREPILNRIHHLLWHEAEVQIQRKLLSEFSASTWDEFCRQLELRSGKPGLLHELPDELRDRILPLYYKLRTRTDTERIIHRLATLGVVSACAVNPAARKFSLTVQVRSESEYRDALEAFMGVFLPAVQVRRELDALSSYPGDSMLERCLYFLVDFSARTMLRRHALRIQEMDTACRAGISGGPEFFRRHVDLTVRAKYALPDALPAALEADAFDRFATCHQFMELLEEDESGSVFGNARHLRVSTEELMRRHGNEPALAALNVFAQMLLASSEKEQGVLQESFVKHVLLCAGVQKYGADAYREAIGPWMQVFRRYFSQEVTQQLREALEAAADRIPRNIDAPTAAPSALSPKDQGDHPDITATRHSFEPREQAAARNRVDSVKQTEASGAASRRKDAAREKDAEREKDAALVKDTSRATEREKRKEGAAGESEEDILRRMEEELGLRDDAPDTRPVSNAHTPAAKTRKTAGADQRKSPDAGAAASRRSRTDEDIDNLLSEIEHTLAPVPAAPREVPKTAAAAAEADPLVASHLTWLKTFNSTFLNAYESRNARLAAGTRKRA